MAHFEIQNLTFSFPGSTKNVLQNVSFSVTQGEYLLICGLSGSGKSTLLRHLKAELTPHGTRQGSIIRPDDVGFVMQDPDAQLVTDKVWHELAFGLECIGMEPTAMRLRVAETANYFGLQNWFHRDTAVLSGGEKQLVNLASVMAMRPQALILDEPTAQLDPIAARNLLTNVRRLNQELGTTVILTEHRLEEVWHAADRVIVLHEGKISAMGSPREVSAALFSKNDPMFCALPTASRVFFACGGKENAPITVREGRLWLEKQEAQSLPGRKKASASDIALELKDLWFRYEKDSPDILRGVDASINKGSLFAVVGGNGSGKSTLLKSICGTCKPYHGKIRLFGENIKKIKNLFQNGISMLPQDPKSLFSHDTVRSELLEMSQSFDDIARLCEIETLLHCHPYDLSGGEVQRVALAKVLLTSPKLLLLDEPTKGCDNAFKERFAEILCKLKSEGITIFMVSHDIEFCARHADQVGMFFDGQLLACAPPQEFFAANTFYTTAARRITDGIFPLAVTAEVLISLCKKEEKP